MTSELQGLSDDRTERTAAAWPPEVRQAMLTTAGRSPGVARKVARDALTSWQLTHLTDTAVLLISELVTNAMVHARADGSGLALSLQIRGSRLRIEVHDGDLRGPRPRTPSVLDESGFGLVLVNALADNWGVRKTAAGKVVWAELDTAPITSNSTPGLVESQDE
jgi:anti-sigma regulatory factor (Ser/Thr protein kinase)